MLCGWASQSEKRTANGKNGDQTGKEVRNGKYYKIKKTKIKRFRSYYFAKLIYSSI